MLRIGILSNSLEDSIKLMQEVVLNDESKISSIRKYATIMTDGTIYYPISNCSCGDSFKGRRLDQLIVDTNIKDMINQNLFSLLYLSYVPKDFQIQGFSL